MKRIKNSWMTISSVKISHPAECNCHLLYRMTSESYLMSSLPLLHLYISQCKFHISCLIPRSSSTCTACTTMYYRFFNIWNKLLKCTYVHLSLFHSNVSNIQQLVVMILKYMLRVRLLKGLCQVPGMASARVMAI